MSREPQHGVGYYTFIDIHEICHYFFLSIIVIGVLDVYVDQRFAILVFRQTKELLVVVKGSHYTFTLCHSRSSGSIVLISIAILSHKQTFSASNAAKCIIETRVWLLIFHLENFSSSTDLRHILGFVRVLKSYFINICCFVGPIYFLMMDLRGR